MYAVTVTCIDILACSSSDSSWYKMMVDRVIILLSYTFDKEIEIDESKL